jgi:hypothetical protein
MKPAAFHFPSRKSRQSLIPIVEFQMSTPVANNEGNSFVTTGTINPGVIWVGTYFQVGLDEAQVPVNRESGHGIGVIGQLHHCRK